MRLTGFATLIALAVAAPATSHAQIGGLIKKAANAATNKAEQKVVENSNLKPSEAFGPELTAQTLDAVLRGLAAAQAKLAEADSLRAERQKIDAAYSKSVEAHDRERIAFEERRDKIVSCQDNVRNERRRTAEDAYSKRMQSDPAAQAKMMQATMAVAQKVSAAQAKGDTAEVRRIMEELARSQGLDPRADSAAAIKECGTRPETPAWLAEQQALRDRVAAFDGRIRNAENNAQSAGAKASGMSFKDYSLARERVLHWYLETYKSWKVQRFGDNERKLMESRRSDIQKYSGALGA